LFGASLLIDCGSPQDQFFTGGIAYTIAGPVDTTLRFSSNATTPFSYKIPVAPDGPYIVKLNFLEPSNVPPARIFSVSINDQLSFPRLTTPGYLIPFARSAIVMSADGFINIRFDTIARSAVISSIEITPFSPVTLPVEHVERITGAIPVWMNDGYYLPRPIAVPDPSIPLGYRDVAVYRNGLRLTVIDYSSAPSAVSQLKIVPQGGQPWPDTDSILVDYTVTW